MTTQQSAHREVIDVDAILGASKLGSFTKVRPAFATHTTIAKSSNKRSKSCEYGRNVNAEKNEVIVIDRALSRCGNKESTKPVAPLCVARHNGASARSNVPTTKTTSPLGAAKQQPTGKKRKKRGGKRSRKKRPNLKQSVDATLIKKAKIAPVPLKTVPPGGNSTQTQSIAFGSTIACAITPSGNKNIAKIVPHSNHGSVGSIPRKRLEEQSFSQIHCARKSAAASRPEKAVEDRNTVKTSSFFKSIFSSAVGDQQETPRNKNFSENSSSLQRKPTKSNHPDDALALTERKPLVCAEEEDWSQYYESEFEDELLVRKAALPGSEAVKILKSTAKYSHNTSTNPSAKECVKRNEHLGKVLEKKLLSSYFGDESSVSEKRNVRKVDFVPEVKDSMRGHGQSIQNYKAMYEMPQRERKRSPIESAYREALLDAFGLRQLFAIELDDEQMEEDITEAEANNIASGCFRMTDSEILRPNISRAMNIVLSNDALVNMRISSQIKEANLKGMTLLFAAVLYGCHKSVLMLLRLGADVRHKDSAKKKAIDYIDRKEALRDKDLGLKLKLLTLCEQSFKLLDEACSVCDWQLVELTIMGVEGFELTEAGEELSEELELQKTLFCSVMLDEQSKGYVTQSAAVSDSIDFSFSRPYVFRLNKKLQLISRSKMEIRLYMGNDAEEGDKTLLSTWGCYSNSLLDAATKEGIGGVFDLLPTTQGVTCEGARLSLYNRLLPYDSAYENYKQSKLVTELPGLIDGFAAWMDDFSSNANDDIKKPSLVDLLEIPHCRGLTLLHAAVYLKDLKLVSRLLKLGVSPHLLSQHGTPLDIAGKLSKRFPGSVVLSKIKALLRHSELK
mmetsp:Transcript_11345/g.17012  ORF Transcript_11345/g.17012 Transcript_11345/m.17012 type:complete len:846 (-) Transcript_11345:15-2552(-)|eukprot:CAMPEP_0196806706 /NCGR_PEP_ID=MMETSP1362-20130617/6616_1 /TAXON_ID=163516 /ORGANISM="Leptocylindrus danicus, Strain CCMP1856" /LENGTH=845 /DNA_ID=CAMNT_0042180305 /DNA_START=62 /DNA_END=2599 /DNA_ORIENTATION=+